MKVKVKTTMADEFRNFILRGNVVDMAVGIIIGAAFGKIVSSLVGDVLMPPIGVMIGGVDFTGFKVALGNDAYLEYGRFLQTMFDFLITAFAVFMVIKIVGRLRVKHDKKEEDKAEATVVAPSKEEQLLTEIRDLLKDNNRNQ